jgi:hypothetical protein
MFVHGECQNVAHIIEWDNAAKTVVLQQYQPGASKDDLYELAHTSAAMLKTVKHTVHLIIDETNIQLMLNNTDLRYLENTVPPNQGIVVLIVPKDTQKYKEVVQIISQPVAPHAFEKTYFVSSVEAARQFLQENFQVEYP